MKRKRSPSSEASNVKNVEIVHEEGKYRVYVQENGKKIVFGKYEDEDGAKEAKLKLLSKNSLTTPQKKVVNAQKKKICSGQAGVRWLPSEEMWLGEFHHAGIRFILGKFDKEADAIKAVRHKRISIGMDPSTNATVASKWRRRLLPKEDKLSWVAKDKMPWKAKLVGVDHGVNDLGEHKHYHDAVKAIMSKRVDMGMQIHELEKKFLTAKDPISIPPEAKVKPKKLVRPKGEKYDCAKCSVTITKVVDAAALKTYGSKYENGYVCDQCHRADATWPMFHCSGCNWDSCMKCLRKSNEKVNCEIDKVMCDICGDGGDENLFILCDYVEHRTKCGTIRKVKDHGCHLRCVGLTKIPKGDWFCSKHEKCKVAKSEKKPKKKKTKKDVKEGKPKPSVPVKKTRKQVQIVPKASSAKGKVEWIPEDSSWRALIWVGKKEEDLGEFRSEEDAVETLRTRQHVLGINDFDFKITIKRGKNWKDKQEKKERKEVEAAKKKLRKKAKKKKNELTSGSLMKKKKKSKKNSKPDVKFEGIDSDSSSDDDDNETIQYKDWNSAGKANKIKQQKKQKEKIKVEKSKPKPKPKPPRKKKSSQRLVAHELFTLQQNGPRSPPKSRKRREADKPLLPRKRRRSVTLVSRLMDALPRGCQQYENKFIDEGFGDADVWEACLEEGDLGPKIKDPMHKNLIMRKMKKIYKDLKAQGNWNN